MALICASSPADLRRNVGFVGQDATLFMAPCARTSLRGAPYADDSAIVTAAEVAGLTQFVNRHPKGFDMLIGERGESLSGGQRQEVAIARAVLMDPPVLLFDGRPVQWISRRSTALRNG